MLKNIVAVHDTVVRVAAPQVHEAPAWVLAVITATAAVIAGVLSQWFRVVLDDNRGREQVRQVLMVEVAVLGVYLEKVRALAIPWQLPADRAFWIQVDNAMRGYDELHTSLVLLPGDVRLVATAWFLRVKSLRLSAESLALDWVQEKDSQASGEYSKQQFEGPFDQVKTDAEELGKWGDEVYRGLFEAVPKPWQLWLRVGAGIKQPYVTLAEARRRGEAMGLLPRRDKGEGH